MELRCPSKLHGVLRDDGTVEFKCDSKFCGHAPGVVVLHRFDAETGELVETLSFKNPTPRERSTSDGDCHERTAVRSEGRQAGASGLDGHARDEGGLASVSDLQLLRDRRGDRAQG